MHIKEVKIGHKKDKGGWEYVTVKDRFLALAIISEYMERYDSISVKVQEHFTLDE